MAASEFPDSTETTVDLINLLAGIRADSPAAALRSERADVAAYIQGSYDALLAPAEASGLSLTERALVALRVAILTESSDLVAHYRQQLAEIGVADETLAAVAAFPAEERFTPRQAAILRHTDRLTHAPGDATPADTAALLNAGLSVSEVVTLAQLISFLSFQVRLLAVAQLFAEEA
jgi:CMD domain protein